MFRLRLTTCVRTDAHHWWFYFQTGHRVLVDDAGEILRIETKR